MRIGPSEALFVLFVVAGGCGQATSGRSDDRSAALGAPRGTPPSPPREVRLTMAPRWRRVSPATTPPARSAAGLTGVPGVGAVLFGGAACPWPCKPLQDVWRFDGADWASLEPTITTGLLPVAHPAWSAPRGQTSLRLAGGFTGQTQTDRELLYFAGGGIWHQLGASPSLLARDAARMVPEANDGRMLLFGGETPDGLGAGTWHVPAGNQPFEKTGDAATPPLRRDHGMAYDPRGEQALLFGGRPCTRGQSCAPLGDRWSRTASAGWTERATTGEAPGARYGHGFAFDEARGVAVLFGGRTEGAVLGDTWELDGDAWRLTVPAGKGPPARAHAAMAYDADREVTVLFGGQAQLVDPESTNEHLDDTWEYGPVDLTCSADAECDTGHCVDGVCCDAASCGTCESCATPEGPGECRPIDGPDPDSCPSSCASGLCGLPAGSSCGGASECHDGFCVGGVCCTSACAGDCDSCATGACETRACELPAGSPCDDGDACADGFCVDGVCCDTACAGACEGCATGSCAPRSADTAPLACPAGWSCDGEHADCTPKSTCSSADECASGVCIGGRCCASLYDCGTSCSADGEAEIDLASGVATPCEHGCWFGRCASEPVDCRVRGEGACPEGTMCGADGECRPPKPPSGAPFDPSTSTGCLCTGAGSGSGRGARSAGGAAALLLLGAMVARRRRGATAAVVAGAPLFLLGGCAVYDTDSGEPCRQAGYAIASRIYACTGDDARSNDTYERFAAHYVCPLPEDDPSSYACALALRDATCDQVDERGDDLDRWLASSRDCLALLSEVEAGDDTCRPLAELVAPKIATCAAPERSFPTIVADALDELSTRRCLPATDAQLDACRSTLESFGCADVSPNGSAVAWMNARYSCSSLLQAP